MAEWSKALVSGTSLRAERRSEKRRGRVEEREEKWGEEKRGGAKLRVGE